MNYIKFILAVTIFVLGVRFSFPSEIEFIGYKGDFPAFDAYKEKKLYVLESDSFVLANKLELNSTLLAVNNQFYLMEKDESGQKKYLLFGNQQTELTIVGKIFSPHIDENGCVFYSDIQDKEVEIRSPNSTLKTVLKGYVTYCDTNFIYYKLSNEESIHPDATDCRFNRKTKAIEKFSQHTDDDTFIFFKGANAFFTYRLMNGGFRPIIYDINKRSFTNFPKEVELNIEQSTCFYDPIKRQFCGLLGNKILVFKQL